MTSLPYPHGTTTGTIGEKSDINTNPIATTTKGMMVESGGGASSAEANKPHWALSANIDHVFGQIQAYKAIPNSKSFTAGASHAQQQLYTDTTYVFLGMSTYSDPKEAFQVLDSEGNELVVDDEKIIVISLKDSIGGAISYPPSAGNEFDSDIYVVFGQESDDSAKDIPNGVDFTVVHCTRGNVDELPIDSLSKEYVKHAQEMDRRLLQNLDRSTENAVIGDPPTLTFGSDGADQNYIGWTAFYCIVRGRIFYIDAVAKSSYINDSTSAALYIDQWGTAAVGTSGNRKRNIEEELVLGFGATGSAAWASSANCARGTTPRPAYITVGSTDHGKCNFDDLENAIEFLNYLWGLIDESELSGENPMEYPRIMICNSVTFSPTAAVTLTGPLWIEGANKHFSSTDAYRYPRIEFDSPTVSLVDCNNNRLKLSNLDMLYVGTSNRSQNTYLFENIGPDSDIERVTVQASGAYSMSGVLEIQGRRSVIKDSYFSSVSETNGTPGIDVADATGGKDGDGLVIARTTVKGRSQAGEVCVQLDSADRVTLDDVTIDTTAGDALAIVDITASCGTIRLEKSKLTSTDDALVVDGASVKLVMKDTDFSGDVEVGTTTAIDTVRSHHCTYDDAVEFRSTHLTIDDHCEFAETVLTTMSDQNGRHVIEDSEFVYGSGTYALRVHINPGAAELCHLLRLAGNTFTVSGSITTYDTVNIYDTTGVVNTVEIIGNVIESDTTAASPNGFNGLSLGALGYQKTVIEKNTIRLTSANDYVTSASRCLSIVDNSSNTRQLRIEDNEFSMTGASINAGSGLIWANIGSDVSVVYYSGPATSATDVWFNNNEIRGEGTSADNLYTAAYFDGARSFWGRGNNVKACYRGIIAVPGATTSGMRCVMNDNTVEFGHNGSDDSTSNWYDSAVGLCSGSDGATAEEYDTIIMFGNTVICNGVGPSGGVRHCIHGEVTPTSGKVSFYGNHVFDDDTYEGSAAVGHSWNFTYTAASDFVPNDNAGQEESMMNNTHPSAFTATPSD